jgi:hypothetical protein
MSFTRMRECPDLQAEPSLRTPQAAQRASPGRGETMTLALGGEAHVLVLLDLRGGGCVVDLGNVDVLGSDCRLFVSPLRSPAGDRAVAADRRKG